MISLADDEIHLYYADAESITDPALLARYLTLLCPVEAARQARFRFEKDRHLFLVAHALVRTVLSKYADVAPQDWRFAAIGNGKPVIAPEHNLPDLQFNLAHTKGLAAVAVARGREVGSDVEDMTRRINYDIARYNFAGIEADDVEAQSDDRRASRFMDYWTLKEAYIKARSLGLSIPLQDFWFQLSADGPPQISFATKLVDNPSVWQFFQDTPTDRHRSAVAVRRLPGETFRLVKAFTIPLV